MYFTNPYRTYLPKVVRPTLPAPEPLATKTLTVQGEEFIIIEKQKEVVKHLLSVPQIFNELVALPYRKLVVHLRDTEYDEAAPLYMKRTLPLETEIEVFANNTKQVAELVLWVEL